MELGQYQLQIFVSLVVILGAAFVALICDFLKGNNEQLRELTVELKVRREEEQRRGQMLTPRPAQSQDAAHTAAARVALEPLETATPAPPVPSTEIRPAKKSFASRKVEGASRRQASADALAAMERGARLAGGTFKAPATASAPARNIADDVQPPPMPAPVAQRPAALLESAPPAIAITNTPAGTEHPVLIETPVLAQHSRMLEQPQASESIKIAQEPVIMTPVATSKKKDWGALLSRRASATAPAPAVSEQKPTENPLANIPAGFHDGFVLNRLILTHQPVTGLVVSIGVSANPKDGTVSEPVTGLIRSLIGAGDFACPGGTGEFLLIYPRLNGAAAQRQLSLVAQQLWDFQLRSLGSTSILFSWGGVEVASESIDEAIASASERMNETRRGRKLITMPLRQAV